MNSCAGGWTCWWCVPISAASWSSIIAMRSSVRTSWLDIYSISRTDIPATTCIQRASGCTNGWCMHWYTWSVRMYIMTMQAPTSRTYWNSWCTNLILGSNNVARQPKKWISKNFEKPPFFGFPKNLGQKMSHIFREPEKCQPFFGFPKNMANFLAQIFREPEKWRFSSFVENSQIFKRLHICECKILRVY